MKMRTGFVSNSSSTSFTIYGVSLSEKDIEDGYKKLFEKEMEYDVSECCEEIADKIGLEFHNGQEGYNQYIGRSYTNIKDEETGKQFKDSVATKLKEVFGEDVKCGCHEESWYNG
jgi:hypothetical protein